MILRFNGNFLRYKLRLRRLGASGRLLILLMRKIVIHDLKFREALLTNRAFQDVYSLLLMRLHMFVEIRFLGKGVFAAMGDADEGLLMRVRSKMIKQIVPFFKHLLAGGDFAKEHLSPTFAFRLEVLDVFESAETGQRY